MKIKLCITCGLRSNRGHNSYCKECHNEYQKAYYKKNPQSIKKSGRRRKQEIRRLIIKAKEIPCSDCGESYPYYVMDLDHIRGEKKFNLSVAARHSKALKTVQKEIDKCDVVCANCHRERTFKSRLTGRPAGLDPEDAGSTPAS